MATLSLSSLFLVSCLIIYCSTMMTTNHVVSSFNYLAPTTNKQFSTITTTSSRHTRIGSSLLSSPTRVHKNRQARIYSSMNGVQQNIDTTYDTNNNDDDENQNKKRVPVTIRYSTESGMKPYYLTVAKRLKDLYPDVIIEPIEVKSFDGFKTTKNNNNGNGSSTRSVGGGGANGNNGQEKVDENMASTIFEVIIDEKTIIRKTIRANTHDNSGSIFVKMSEIEMAVTRARKRRRPGPATVYSENNEATSTSSGGGGTTSTINLQDQDQLLVKSRFENLKNKSSELQQLKKKEMKNFNKGSNSVEKTSGSNGSSVSNIGFE
mmetsp:Transcript_31677/g.36361  ORF Transcript_31677/g.36361 Transcript_31677/m.36361 type:complete len:320 (+) Transcript_31677:103-1062(+)